MNAVSLLLKENHYTNANTLIQTSKTGYPTFKKGEELNHAQSTVFTLPS
ncbi:hypothetical protein MM326_09740 [Alkalihalobacillus sp. LMS6]|nr:hypothetical protein [Alkalihalobacillus sp. LMS6]UTR08271.1 hypothetical protein MM326_09740 [Alkalihalobacillus sp. LMS6]